MVDLIQTIKSILKDSLLKLNIQDLDPQALAVQKSTLSNTHFQSNIALRLSKSLQVNPIEFANSILTHIDQSMFSEVSVTKPGFINFRFSCDYLSQCVNTIRQDNRFGFELNQPKMTVVIDYSSPNVAKEMHVGHLRSTIIGDAIARIFTFCGHQVIRQNHVGDWGTQFGMLIEYLLHHHQPNGTSITQIYQDAKALFDQSDDFKKQARQRVVLLQQGDPQTLAIWEKLVMDSEKHFESVYQQLNVLLGEADIRPESFYNPQLEILVKELLEQGVAKEDQGAITIALDGFVNPDDQPIPMIIQKSDGGYLYATTDLAALRFRIEQLKADQVIYCVDARQDQHFKMLFAATAKTPWHSFNVQMKCALFGTILGKDGKPFKTRSGETVRLLPLIEEAVAKSRAQLKERHPDWSTSQLDETANAIGIGSLKYADLCNDKIKNYQFNSEKMLSLDGNTAPYLQNAYVRIQSILRKSNRQVKIIKSYSIDIMTDNEIDLALHIAQFPKEITMIAENLEIHRLCHYLYQLATLFHRFYESDSILNAPNEKTCNSRLALANLTGSVLQQGLNLLGINTIDFM